MRQVVAVQRQLNLPSSHKPPSLKFLSSIGQGVTVQHETLTLAPSSGSSWCWRHLAATGRTGGSLAWWGSAVWAAAARWRWSQDFGFQFFSGPVDDRRVYHVNRCHHSVTKIIPILQSMRNESIFSSFQERYQIDEPNNSHVSLKYKMIIARYQLSPISSS